MSAGQRPRNPYGQLTPIRSADMFFGREDSLDILCNALLDGQSMAITGPRRVGKSSLLACCRLPAIYQRVGCDLSNHLLILLDLEEYLQRTAESFFTFVCEQLLQQARPRLDLELPAGSGADQFSTLLSEFKNRGFHTVLLLDEFDSIVRNPHFNPDFFSFLRSQANAGKVSYVTASLARLDKISHSEIVGSPFFNIFSHHTLGPLTQKATIELITVPANRAGCSFNEKEIQFILKIAGRHPFYIQRACYFLFQHKTREHSHLSLSQLAHQIYDELLPHFAYAWNHLQPDQEDQLKREAIRKDTSQRAFPALSESALFRKFVRQKAKVTFGEITMEYLRTALDKLDDFTFLGTSRLSSLNVIYNQEQGELFTPVERGIRVARLLQEAHSRLQPPGPSSTMNPEWQAYQVLQYCYFKKDRRSKKQLAGFLGMSERDFYRKRDDAVNALLSIIFTLEAEQIDRLDVQHDAL
jgi:hypothetical protein